MAQIAVDFLQGTGLLSRAISWFGQGPDGWSHCASVLADGRYLDARDQKLGNVPAGVHIRQPETEKWTRKRRASKEVTQAQYEDWEANLRGKITANYGTSDIESFILDRDLHEGGRWICSALAINAVQHIRLVPYPLPIPAHQITPNAALLILATAGFEIGPVQIQA